VHKLMSMNHDGLTFCGYVYVCRHYGSACILNSTYTLKLSTAISQYDTCGFPCFLHFPASHSWTPNTPPCRSPLHTPECTSCIAIYLSTTTAVPFVQQIKVALGRVHCLSRMRLSYMSECTQMLRLLLPRTVCVQYTQYIQPVRKKLFHSGKKTVEGFF